MDFRPSMTITGVYPPMMEAAPGPRSISVEGVTSTFDILRKGFHDKETFISLVPLLFQGRNLLHCLY
jgi:hypothetical protein